MQSLCYFTRRGKIYFRKLVIRYILKLDKAKDSLFPVGGKPLVNGLVIVTAFFVSLCQAPASVLTSLDGNFQHFIPFCGNKVIFWLICAILNRNINPVSGKLRGSKRFSSYAYMP